MQKSQASTGHSSSQNSRNNEAHLVELVKNLQLQLGYHAIALKKAEQMIKLLQNDNKKLVNQNQMLRVKCGQLEFRLVQYENQLSAISQVSSNAEYMECLSAGLQRKKYHHAVSQLNIQPQKSISSRSITKHSPRYALEPETPNRKKTNPLFKSTQLLEMPKKKYQQNQAELLSPMKRKKVKASSKQNALSCSFIPFQQLQFKANWD